MLRRGTIWEGGGTCVASPQFTTSPAIEISSLSNLIIYDFISLRATGASTELTHHTQKHTHTLHWQLPGVPVSSVELHS